jgi:hypothetical protein
VVVILVFAGIAVAGRNKRVGLALIASSLIGGAIYFALVIAYVLSDPS